MRGIIASLGLLCSTAVVWAETPEPLQTRITQLGHSRYTLREQAAKELEQMGEPALPALRKALQTSDVELRERAAKVIQRIEFRARSERLLQPPKMTIVFDETPLDTAIVELSRKLGLSLELDAKQVKNPKRPVTIKVEDVPYWEALARFYQAAGLVEFDDIPQAAASSQTMLEKREIVYGPRQMPKAHLLRLRDGTSQELLLTDKSMRVRVCAKHPDNKYDDTRGEVFFKLKIDPTPSLSLQDILGVEVRYAHDEHQRTLVRATPPELPRVQNDYEEMVVMNGMRTFVQNSLFEHQRYTTVGLKTEGIRPKHLKELSGVVVAQVLTPPETLLTIADFTHNTAQNVATTEHYRCEVTGTRTSTTSSMIVTMKLDMNVVEDFLDMPIQFKGRVRPFVRIQRSGGGELGNGLPKVAIRDQSGKTLKHSLIKMDGTSDGINMTYTIELRIDQPKPTDQLSLALEGRRPATIEMPFTLKNVPLP